MDPVTNTSPVSNESENNLFDEIQIMLDFVYTKGIKLPDNISTPSLTNDKTNINAVALASDYNALVAAIVPSTPESIKYIGNEFTGNISAVKSWKIPAVKKYIVITILALIGLIGFSLMPDVNAENQEKGILALSGIPLLVNLSVIFFAALLGVMFYILKTIKDKIDNFTLDGVDIFSYNISIIIGIVSGFIISELFTFATPVINSSIEIHKMTMALLGGFASDAIFSILQNLVNKIKSLLAT